MLVTMRAFDLALIVDATQSSGGSAVAGVLNGMKMVLFTNQPSLNKDTVIGDLTPPTYTGYAAQTVTWSAARSDGNGKLATFTGLVNWQPTADTVPGDTIYGYGLTDSAGTTLLAAEMLPAPQGLGLTTDYFGLIAEWTADNSNPGSATLVS